MSQQLATQRRPLAIIIPAVIFTAALCRPAAGDAFIIHENLHADQKVHYAVTFDYKVKSVSVTNFIPSITDTENKHAWEVTVTIKEEKDGSSVLAVADVDPDGVDTTRLVGEREIKTPCPYAGKTITLTRHPDDSIVNDFQGAASDDDVNLLNNFVTPDAEWYPDKPVAVGDTWDDSAKVGKFASLGPRDQLTAQGRLDWVKTIDGRQEAQITNTCNCIYHEDGNVEEDVKLTATQWVDIASGIIVKCDEIGSSKYTTPATEATRVTGGTQFTLHEEVLPDVAVTPAAKP